VTRPIRAVLFDLDGTLIATRQLYVAAYAAALAPVVGRHLSEDEIMARRPGAETVFLPQIAGPAAADACLADFYDHYAGLHGEHFRGIYNGVLGMLSRLRARAVPVGLFTGKSRRAWNITRQHADLGPFAAGVFGDEVERQKPAPDGVVQAAAQLGVPPGDIIYVGDAVSDLQAACAAGCRAGAVLWSKRDDERDTFRQQAAQADAVTFDTPADLADWAEANVTD